MCFAAKGYIIAFYIILTGKNYFGEKPNANTVKKQQTKLK